MDAGTAITVTMTKWGGHPHWSFEGIYLGSDEHGEWLGHPVGTRYSRPGTEFVADFGCVSLVPRSDRAHFPAFRTPGRDVDLYVDVVTPPEWSDTTLATVDLDLDVVRRGDGEVFIDDEDEFEEHQAALGYPPEIIALAEESAERVYAAIVAADPPYDGSHRRWLDLLPR